MDDLDLSAVSNFDVNRDKLLRHVAIVAIFLGFNTPWSCKKGKNWHVWLSCAWLPIRNKTKPILFLHRSTIQMAVSAKKDWDPEIVLPWLRDVTLFSTEQRRTSWRRKSWRWLPHRLSKRHVTVNNNIPIQDYVHPNDQTQSTFEMTLGYKPFTELELLSTLIWLLVYCNSRSCFVQQRLRIQSCVLREKKQFVFSNFVLHHILGDPYYNDKLISWIRSLDFSLGI